MNSLVIQKPGYESGKSMGYPQLQLQIQAFSSVDPQTE